MAEFGIRMVLLRRPPKAFGPTGYHYKRLVITLLYCVDYLGKSEISCIH